MICLHFAKRSSPPGGKKKKKRQRKKNEKEKRKKSNKNLLKKKKEKRQRTDASRGCARVFTRRIPLNNGHSVRQPPFSGRYCPTHKGHRRSNIRIRDTPARNTRLRKPPQSLMSLLPGPLFTSALIIPGRSAAAATTALRDYTHTRYIAKEITPGANLLPRFARSRILRVRAYLDIICRSAAAASTFTRRRTPSGKNSERRRNAVSRGRRRRRFERAPERGSSCYEEPHVEKFLADFHGLWMYSGAAKNKINVSCLIRASAHVKRPRERIPVKSNCVRASVFRRKFPHNSFFFFF